MEATTLRGMHRLDGLGAFGESALPRILNIFSISETSGKGGG